MTENKVKTILITGTSSGIGLATARFFLEKGWNVVATMRSYDSSLFPASPQLLIIEHDVTNSKKSASVITKAIEHFGKIDVVVNNAGYGLIGPVETATEEQIATQFQTNVLGLMTICRLIIPHFRKQGGGRIINISSMMGKITMPYFAFYNSTKWAVDGFSEALQYELNPFNIKVKIIEPGAVATNFFATSAVTTIKANDTPYFDAFNSLFKGMQTRMKTAASPQVVAQTIYQAATDKTPQMRYVPDPTAKALITLRTLTPNWLFRLLISLNVK